MRLLLLCMLCAVPVLAGDAAAALMQADRDFDQATAQKGLEGWMSFFADDARLNQRGGPIEGKAAVRAFYAKMFSRKNFSIRWKPLHAEASKDGSLGYTFGEAQISWEEPNGETRRADGRYVTVWRRQADGAYKVVTDLGN